MSKPAQNRLLIILILGSLSTLSPFAIDMYLPAFPEIAGALHVSTAKVSLSVSSYFAGIGIGQIIYGPLLDRFGRKIPLYVGLAIFVVASLLCVTAHNIEWLTAMRCLQAIGGCAAQVAAMAMVRDFFPVNEMAKIISWLILIIGVSPLLAPSAGSAIATHLGWRWVFIILALVAFFNLAVCWLLLPQGHTPDKSVSLRPLPIMRNYWAVLREPQFLTFALAGSFSFSGLLAYVAGSPIIFMEVFHVDTRTFGFIFAGLAVGFIGSNQINVLLLRRFSSAQIFLGALLVQCPVTILFFIGAIHGSFGLAATLVLLFISLTSMGLAFPNAAALALSPFDHNIGSASAMLGCLQIGVSGIASASIGVLDSHRILPIALILAGTSAIGLAIYLEGRRRIGSLSFVEEQGATPIAH